MKSTVLGEGVLGWHSIERHFDRYGAVHLNTKTAANPSHVDFSAAPTGRAGAFVAVVLEVRVDIEVIETPRIGQVFPLGYGELFTEDMNPNLCVVGVLPRNKRRKPWLNVDHLVTCRDQWVRLELRA